MLWAIARLVVETTKVYTERYDLEVQMGVAKRSRMYPSDTLTLSFGESEIDDVQIAITTAGTAYLECVDKYGDAHRIYLGEARA